MIVKLWDGTTAHASVDCKIMSDITSLLKNEGITAIHKFWYSFEDLKNGTIAYVTHTRRSNPINPYSSSWRDSERFKLRMYDGSLPNNISVCVYAHLHTSRGSIEDGKLKIVYLPAWSIFQPYPSACANFPHWQPDIGAYFLFVTEGGRIKLLKWLYKPFVYVEIDDKIYEGDGSSEYVDCEKPLVLDAYLKDLIETSIFKVCMIADLHVGSKYAITPEKYKDINGNEWIVPTNKANRRLMDYWHHFAKVFKTFKFDELWIIGDAIAGLNVFDKQICNQINTLDEQKYAFIEVIKELFR